MIFVSPHLNRVISKFEAISTELIDEENHVQHWLRQSLKQGLNNWEKHHKCCKSFPILSLEWTNWTYLAQAQSSQKLTKYYLESWIYAWRFISKTNEEGVEDSKNWEHYPSQNDNKDAQKYAEEEG